MYLNNNLNQSFFIRNCLIFFLFLFFLEGIIRKWIFSFISYEIIILRDLCLIVAILFGFQKKIYKSNEQPEQILFLISAIVVTWSLLQTIFIHEKLTIFLIGIRNWVLFYWFVLLFFRIIKKYDEIKIILNLIYITLLPIILLAIIQYYSPLESTLNKQTIDGVIGFQIITGVIRPSSIFTFTYNYTQYLSLATTLLLASLSTNHYNLNINSLLKFSLIILLIFAALTSGSRGYLIYFILIFSIFIFINLTNKKLIVKKNNIIPILLVVGLILFLDLDLKDVFYERFSTAAKSENFFSRIMYTIFGNKIVWDELSIFGNGLGISSNLARPFVNVTNFYLGEFDSDRVLNEGGVLGILFLIIKLIFIIKLFFKTIEIKQYSYDNYVMSLFIYFFLVHQLLISSITGQIGAHSVLIIGLSIYFVFLKKKNIYD